MPQLGWEAVTVRGAVAAWAKLVHRFGRPQLAEVAASAIRFAREGFGVTPIIATLWRRAAGVLGS
jgi:gamma-glutamyltranspeptidase / glutathione hydrolase